MAHQGFAPSDEALTVHPRASCWHAKAAYVSAPEWTKPIIGAAAKEALSQIAWVEAVMLYCANQLMHRRMAAGDAHFLFVNPQKLPGAVKGQSDFRLWA